MKSKITAEKSLKVLEKAIVKGLEDIKAIDIKVFDTDTLSPLFERVIIATGSSNRQTKALAASVKRSLAEAGLDKPRVEGETNGEWIIVDCGAAVAHIMQPVFRQYYHLEDLWGEKPVKLGKTAVRVKAEKVAKATATTKAVKVVKTVKSTKASQEKAAEKPAKRSATKKVADPKKEAKIAGKEKPASKKLTKVAAPKKTITPAKLKVAATASAKKVALTKRTKANEV